MMTDKKTLFTGEYLKDFNATKAAIRAGYSEKTAYSQGQRLLKDVEIRKIIKDYIDESLDNSKMTLKVEIIDKLKEIAFSTPDLSFDKDGELVGASYRDSLKALELLGKFMTMFSDRKDVNVTISPESYESLKGLYE